MDAATSDPRAQPLGLLLPEWHSVRTGWEERAEVVVGLGGKWAECPSLASPTDHPDATTRDSLWGTWVLSCLTQSVADPTMFSK